MEYQKRSFILPGVATIASVLGGITGYFIGRTLGNRRASLVLHILSQATFDHAVEQFKEHQNWAVLIAGFTPVPYKAVTLGAGFCKLPLYHS